MQITSKNILIGIVIVSILAALLVAFVIFREISSSSKMNFDLAQNSFKRAADRLEVSVEDYYRVCKKLPHNLSILVIGSPTDKSCPSFSPKLDNNLMVQNRWGHQLLIESLDQVSNSLNYKIISLGKDNKVGGINLNQDLESLKSMLLSDD
jgi:hypothetical protein